MPRNDDFSVLPFMTEGTLVRAMIAKLKAHPLVRSPLVFDKAGKQIIIRRFRDFDGWALKTPPKELTLSVYPYHYGNGNQASTLSANSANASVVFVGDTLGGGQEPGAQQAKKDMNATVRVHSLLVFKIHLAGFDQTTANTSEMGTQRSVDEFDENEHVLRLWAPILAAILRSDELRTLHTTNLDPETGAIRVYKHLTNSSVKNISYDTSNWANNANLIFKTASIQMECIYYVPRHLFANERWTWVEPTDGQYLELGTIPDPLNLPDGVRDFRYDLVNHAFVDGEDNPLSEADYIDVSSGNPYPGVDLTLFTLVTAQPDLSLATFPLFFTRTEPEC